MSSIDNESLSDLIRVATMHVTTITSAKKNNKCLRQ